MKLRRSLSVMALLLCLPLSVQAATPALRPLDGEAMADIYAPLDENGQFPTSTLEGVSQLVKLSDQMLKVALPPETVPTAGMSNTLVRKSDDIIYLEGSFSLPTADNKGETHAYMAGFTLGETDLVPAMLMVDDKLAWSVQGAAGADVTTAQGLPSFNPNATVYAGLTLEMRSGDSVDDAKRLQQALKELGFYRGDLVENFGPATKKAVGAFQKANGLTANGVANTETLALLYGGPCVNAKGDEVSVSAKAMTISYRTLRRGKVHDNVLRLQEVLQGLGYYEADLSTTFGTKTESAVKAFQKANSLTANGVADNRTLTLLYTGKPLP